MDVQVYIKDIAEFLAEDNITGYEERLRLLPVWRLEKVRRFKQHPDRVRCAEAFLLLEQSLKADFPDRFYLMEDVRKNGFYRGENGKPYFREGAGLFFNLSHSGDKVMCVIADREVGCDVEKIADYREGIAKRFFHKREQEFIEAARDKADAFYRIWTLKESVMKACGKGMQLAMDSFCVTDGPYVDLSGERFELDRSMVKSDGCYAYARCVASR